MVIEVRELTKRYGDVVAVDNLSFDVGEGEVFGLLGPNGAGKTTAIRIIMDILQPDEGSVRVLDQPPGRAKDHVGYLPEERGLYRNLKVLDVLTYFGELKGLDRATGRERATALLSEVQLQDWGNRKVRDLSRGMQQKVQFIATLVHDPELLFLDEPFQGLDPVNVEQMRDFIARLHAQGKTIVLSTHQMGLVEALCDRILLIDHGQAVLYGPLEEIKRRYAPNAIRVRADQLPSDLPGVQQVEPDNGAYRLTLAESARARDVLRALLDRGADVRGFEVAPVPLEEIFVTVVTGRGR